MDDYIVRIIARDAGLRGLACLSTNTVRDGAARHGTSPLATAALGHGLTSIALLGALLKVRQRVALRVAGDGPLGKMVVESDSYGRVRGYVAAQAIASSESIGPDEVSQAIGRNGLLRVVKDLRLRDLYEGVVPLESGRLDQELARYLVRSEQVPSLVEIGVRMDAADALAVAGGLLIQTMPPQGRDALDELAERLDDLPPLATLLADGESPEVVLQGLFRHIPFEVLEKRPLAFHCSCSRERCQYALTLIGRSELESLWEEGEAVVDCHFCHEQYVFGRQALEAILADLDGGERTTRYPG